MGGRDGESGSTCRWEEKLWEEENGRSERFRLPGSRERDLSWLHFNDTSEGRSRKSAGYPGNDREAGHRIFGFDNPRNGISGIRRGNETWDLATTVLKWRPSDDPARKVEVLDLTFVKKG